MLNTWNNWPSDENAKAKNGAAGAPDREMQYLQYLATAVTLRIKQLRLEGGPTVAWAERLTTHLDQAEAAPLYRLSQADQQAPATRRLVEALAALSFIPGGIDALGLHCQANRDPAVTMLCISLI
jgi:hypothetical protein